VQPGRGPAVDAGDAHPPAVRQRRHVAGNVRDSDGGFASPPRGGDTMRWSAVRHGDHCTMATVTTGNRSRLLTGPVHHLPMPLVAVEVAAFDQVSDPAPPRLFVLVVRCANTVLPRLHLLVEVSRLDP
jgi:hypothetical protein